VAPTQSCDRFLGEVAAVVLADRAEAAAGAASAVTVPLPVHARHFLDGLPLLPDADAVAGALKPLLSRLARVTRWRRTGIVAGCLAFPLLASIVLMFGVTMMEQWSRKNPDLAELQELLQTRTSQSSRWMKDRPHPTDRQFALYIAGHYRRVITNDAAWSTGLALAFIKGEPRRFAEQSLAENRAPTETELKEADAVVEKYLHKSPKFEPAKQPWFPFAVMLATLGLYVAVPALVAALLFRGGLVLLAARVTFVRRDGQRASRLRVFWRALVVWSSLLLGVEAYVVLAIWLAPFAAALGASLSVCALAIVSLALPDRGLPDRLAGTWPVPR
jgi:hypothetical protein